MGRKGDKMAEFGKYSASGIGRVLQHNNRKAGDGIKRSNEMIDPERTVYNYHLKKGTIEDVKKRLSEVFILKRKDTTVLSEMIVTLPKNVKSEDERDFFQAVYEFYCKDFGEENIINAVVHKDETQPHLHLDFIPVLKGVPEYTSQRARKAIEEWKKTHNGNPPTERVCCKDLITRKYLAEMHPRLSEYVKNYLGYEAEIINGATEKGNRTILKLKNETLMEKNKQLETQNKHLSEEINSMLSLAKKHGINGHEIGVYPLLQRIADLENQNAILKGILVREGYMWKNEDLKAMKAKKYIPAKSVPVNVYEGSLVNAEIEENAVIVIELPDKIPRPLPQQELIENDPDLERQMRFFQSSEKQVGYRPSRRSDQIYLFIKTDNVKQTIENILLMEQELRKLDLKNRRVYMDKMETDIYDLARAMLTKNKIEAYYFTRIESDEKEKGDETAGKEMQK